MTRPSPGESWLSKPESYGNKAGDTISSTLGKVGQPVGKGLSYGTAPVGNIVDSLVGGVMRSGEMANDAPQHGEGIEKTIGDKVGEGQKALGDAIGQTDASKKGQEQGQEAVREGKQMVEGQKEKEGGKVEGKDGGEGEGKGKIEMRDEDEEGKGK